MATARTSSQALRQLVGQFIDKLAQDLLLQLDSNSGDLRDVWRYVDLAAQQETSPTAFAEAYATTLTSIVIGRRLADGIATGRAWSWLKGPADSIWPTIFSAAERLDAEFSFSSEDVRDMYGQEGEDATVFFLEQLLGDHARIQRRRRGVYLTPRSAASYMIRELESTIQDELGWRDGWLDLGAAQSNGERLRVVDPACGTGVFLRRIVEHAHKRYEESERDGWSGFVNDHLLPNMIGFDVMLPSVAVARIQLAESLLRTGYDFSGGSEPHVFLMNSLAAPRAFAADQPFGRRLGAVEEARLHEPVTVFVGNPPFSGDSQNRNDWIDGLLKGRVETESPVSYYATDAGPIGEKKVWLQDDYIKFYRFAQWRLRTRSTAALCFLSNHGFLDGATFRGMRYQLTSAFPICRVLDLHGSVKKRELSRAKEQNIFPIEAGVCVANFVRRPGAEPEVRAASIWGSRAHKLKQLEAGSFSGWPTDPVACVAPHYLLVARDLRSEEEFKKGWAIPDVMPVHSTAAVTARDRFVIDQHRETLEGRLTEFVDAEVSDAEIRAKFFNNSRSPRYPAGDTRGWKLGQARSELRSDNDYRAKIRDCCFRPFDKRHIVWTPQMIDWPRPDVMRHMTEVTNIALVTRRQMCPGQPCNFFFVADDVVIDGLIRSDNRGTESFFPLYLAGDSATDVNFDERFLAALSDRIDGRFSDPSTPGLEVFNYIYATFHDSHYRARFAAPLTLGYPRVFLPVNADVFHRLVEFGARLVELQLLRFESPPGDLKQPIRIERGFPKWHDGRLSLNRDCHIEVEDRVWQYRIGSYQVLSKWLKERRHQELQVDELALLQQMTSAIHHILSVEAAIGQFVEQNGGWESCFATG